LTFAVDSARLGVVTGVLMRDFRILNKDKTDKKVTEIRVCNGQQDSPISRALFKHFEKYDPELISEQKEEHATS